MVRAKQCSQKMSDLPVDRISKSAPFENVGCDFFGPFQIKLRRSLVKSIIFKCVGCRRLRAKQCTQKMSDLPVDRISQTAPFENVGCDFFGPFQIKIRRSFVKSYGCVFTCP